MKKLVISGSSKLHERALYWRGYFEGRGYEVIDWPCPISTEEETLDEAQTEPGLSLGRWLSSSDKDYNERLTKIYQRFYKNIDQCDTFFLMNEDRDGIEGYIGASMIAEITYAIIGNLNRGRKVEINILKLPSKEQNCYEEVKFWLDQDWIKIYHRPTGKKAAIPVTSDQPQATQNHLSALESGRNITEVTTVTQKATEHKVTEGEIIDDEPPRKTGLFGRNNKSIDIITCKKKCLRSLLPEWREYLKILSTDFPVWLLKYLDAPEMQRLTELSNTCGACYSSLFQYKYFSSVFAHSLGVALIVWNFTHSKKQTLAGLFHDIATPSFKHSIDFMNGDDTTQESTEARTEQIIRGSHAIMKQLKKDGILPSEVSDYHRYPIADNETPNLSADRLEYTFSNGYFLYNTWTFDQIKRFYQDITILKNENEIDELGFQSADIAAEFTTNNLPLAAIYNSDKTRALMQFLADIVQSMISAGYLSEDDLYVMSERELIDWILSCGDKTISEAFRQFQRATTIYAGGISKKNCYCTSSKGKVRYIVPLVAPQPSDEERSEDEEEPAAVRITKLSNKVNRAVKAYLDEKQSKYVGFDFDFKPYVAEP